MTTLLSRQRWPSPVVDLVRGASGGLLFGVPLLYTVEVHWTGQHTTPAQALGVVALSLLGLAVLNRTAGFRAKADRTALDAALDAIEGVALALLLSTAVLALLGEVGPSKPLMVNLAKIVYETLPVSLGVGVADTLLKESSPQDASSQRGSTFSTSIHQGPTHHPSLNATVADLGASAIGAAVVALSIAPTEEVTALAATRSPLQLLIIVGATLMIAYAIVFQAGLSGQSRRHAQQGLLQHPLIETMAAYVVAMLVSLILLGIFQRADAAGPVVLGQMVVLSLPAAIGGAAGRLAL